MLSLIGLKGSIFDPFPDRIQAHVSAGFRILCVSGREVCTDVADVDSFGSILQEWFAG